MLKPRGSGWGETATERHAESEQPYYFEAKDVTRELARRYGVLETSVSAPKWGLEQRPQQEHSVFAVHHIRACSPAFQRRR